MAADRRSGQEVRALGRGMAMPRIDASDHGRDLVFVAKEGRKHLAVVEGVACFAQDMEVALTTALGSDQFNTGFGFDGLIALATETIPALVRERVRIAVVQVLRRDPRVRSVLDIRLEEETGGALAFGGRTAKVRIEVELVTGEMIALSAGLAGFQQER